MKIFFISPLVTHYRETFYEKLIRANPQHEWLIIDGEKKIDDGRPNFYKQFQFPHKRFEETFKKIGPFSLRDYVGLAKFIKQEKPDLVITPAIVGTRVYRDIARMARKKEFKFILWTCFWEHPDVKNSLLYRVKNIILKRYLNSADYQVGYSSYAKKKLIKFGFPADKILIAYNGIEIDDMESVRIDEIKRKAMRKKLGIEDHAKIFLCVGGLGPDKNVKLLLEAIILLKKSDLQIPFVTLIIGDGPQREMLNQFVSQSNIAKEVKFLGRIVDDVNDYFQCSDCLVLPGAGGLSLNQAMYWKKTCIVSHADGTEEDLIYEGVTGFRFEPDNAVSLKEALVRFINTPETKLNQMGEKGNQLVNEQSNVSKMVETFSEAIKLTDLKK